MYDNYSSLLKHGWLLFFLQHVSNCINLDEAVEILKKNVIKFMVSVNFFFLSLLVSLTFSFSTPCGKNSKYACANHILYHEYDP